MRKLQLRLPWGRSARAPKPAKHKKTQPPAFIAMPHRRPLTVKDTIFTDDKATGTRHYLPLVVRGEEGRHWYAIGWMHCGAIDGVLLVRAEDVGNPRAFGYWKALADGVVCVVEGSAG